jgi:hypothetical protein
VGIDAFCFGCCQAIMVYMRFELPLLAIRLTEAHASQLNYHVINGACHWH